MTRRHHLLGTVVILGLAWPAAARDKQLGATVQKNIALQAVDLNPVYAGVRIEGTTGITSEAAITRFRNGRVTPLQSLGGTSVIGNNAGQQGAAAPANATGPR